MDTKYKIFLDFFSKFYSISFKLAIWDYSHQIVRGSRSMTKSVNIRNDRR